MERNRPKKVEDGENSSMNKRSQSPDIKSTTVVKYSSVVSPVEFARLQCNTDLNLPPSNWQSAIDSYGLKQILRHSTQFSSFTMAHMFPDCVGEVDVISGAECIKTLLKLPYHPKGKVSMMVHRVENTILLDDFDIYDYLMKSEWEWLRNFFYENIVKTMTEQEKMIAMKNEGGHILQLVSKFLCHSVVPCPEQNLVTETPIDQSKQVILDGPSLPEPECEEENLPKEHSYNRNVLWTFEDIQMLIGSDLPIFGGVDRPCVSLRLRDASETINVLTGIDYWLDNLMCNVPEVLMCYHIDGIVQRYEPMKTEDIPHLEGSKFSPKVIRNVAQNILSFLKSNATKAGHTYWLFKGEHDDVVKLYDLTSLCGGLDSSEALDNPFITPVAMLLYRVARNMRLTGKTRHVRMLLENAIRLLTVEKHPQIVASSHYMLADLYLPANTNPASPNFNEDTSEDSDPGEEDDDFCMPGNKLALPMDRLAIHDIGKNIEPSNEEQKSKKPQSLGINPPERCGKALLHALKGLQALHHITIDKCKEEEKERLRQERLAEEQNPNMANPYEPISMDYKPLNKNPDATKAIQQVNRGRKRRKSERKSNKDQNAILACSVKPRWFEPNANDNFAWKLHLKTLLYEKICLAYSTLAEYSYVKDQYGFSLKYIDFANKCQFLLSNMILKSQVVDRACLYGRAGDNYFQIAKNFNHMDSIKKQYETDHEVDRCLKEEISKDMREEFEDEIVENVPEKDFSLPKDLIESMTLSIEAYKMALEVSVSGKKLELLRRLASVQNELGVIYMHSSQEAYVKYYKEIENSPEDRGNNQLSEFENMSSLSLKSLTESAEIFQQVKDDPNLALLYCNMGRYMRFKTHCCMKPFGPEQRSGYNAAERHYLEALSVLGNRNKCPSIWDTISWELSSATYALATIMQENPENFEASEVADALKHALKYCVLTSGPRQYLYQFRAAMIWHRLGSLHHSQYRETTDDGTKRRALAALSKTAYEHATSLLATLEDTQLFLTVQLEHVALCETQANNTPSIRLKSLQNAFELLRQCKTIIKLISEKDSEEKLEPKSEDRDDTIQSEYSLLKLFESRLQYVLKHIIQYCRSKFHRDYEKILNMYKEMYTISLKIGKFNSEQVQEYAACLYDTFNKIDELKNENNF